MRAERFQANPATVTGAETTDRKTQQPAVTPESPPLSALGAAIPDTAGAALIGDRLDALACEAAAAGMAQHDIIRAVMAWAAGQSYAAGGYPHARLTMLDTLETILILDAAKKTAA